MIADISKKNESDIKKLFAKGRAIIGHLQKNHHKLIQFFVYEKSNTVTYCVKCNKIQIWQETTAIDVSTLAWAYIDMLSLLANNIRVQSIVKNE